MKERTNVRLVVTLVTALCVVTMFAGVGTAQLGVLDQDLDGEVTETGGNGSGTVGVDVPDQGNLEGTGSVAGDVEEQEVTVAVDGEGSAAGETVELGLECTLSPDAVSEGLTSGCETAPVDAASVIDAAQENPEQFASLVETIGRQMVQNPEQAPELVTLLGLFVPGVDALPLDQIPWEQVPWEQVPTDQIPVEDFPQISEQIPWDQIPSDQAPLSQQDIDQQLAL